MPAKPRYVSEQDAFTPPPSQPKPPASKDSGASSSAKKIEEVMRYIETKLSPEEIVELSSALQEATNENQQNDENSQELQEGSPAEESSESTNAGDKGSKAAAFSDEEMPA